MNAYIDLVDRPLEAEVRSRVAMQAGQRLVREGLAAVLEDESDVHVVSVSSSFVELAAACGDLRPDVVLMEVDAGHVTLAAVTDVRRAVPTAHVVGLSDALSRPRCRDLRAAGVDLLIDRQLGIDAVVDAVRKQPISSPPPAPAVAQLRTGSIPMLTPRELDVLRFVGKGVTSREISESLGISRKTVENHKQRSFQKLGVQNQAHAVSEALRHGILVPTTTNGV